MWQLILFLALTTAAHAATLVVSGQSMEPTLMDGQTVTVEPYGASEEPARDDILVFHSIRRGVQIKRVIGVPEALLDTITTWRRIYTLTDGSSVRFLIVPKDSMVVNGQTVSLRSQVVTDVVHKGVPYPPGVTNGQIPAGSWYVHPDSPLSSLGSNRMGYITLPQIIGKVMIPDPE